MDLREYEEVIKSVMDARRVAENAAACVQSLDDKIRFVKMGRKLTEAQNILRLFMFEFEDAYEALSKTAVRCTKINEFPSLPCGNEPDGPECYSCRWAHKTNN